MMADTAVNIQVIACLSMIKTLVSLLSSLSSHLLDSTKYLADLKDLIHFTVPREKRSESVEFSHDAAHSPQVNRRAVGGRPEQDLWSSIPSQRKYSNKQANTTDCTKSVQS